MNAVMGHSMGGGASMLAAAGDTIVRAVANFAAANTTPSAILAAADITVPALLFSGSGDCVTPPSEHQEPMYDSLVSDCKTLTSITGGGHCYFANDNFLCTFGENSCGPGITITREEQHDAMFDFLLPWLDHFLKGDQEAWEIFADSLATSDRITFEQDCEMTGIYGKETGNLNLKAFPVPFHNYFTITGNFGGGNHGQRMQILIFSFSFLVLTFHRKGGETQRNPAALRLSSQKSRKFIVFLSPNCRLPILRASPSGQAAYCQLISFLFYILNIYVVNLYRI